MSNIDDHARLRSSTPATSASPRVLHGMTGAAGQPWTISRAQRRLGISSDCVLVGSSKYSYGADLHVEPTSDELADVARFLLAASPNYDIFHFYFRPYFMSDSRHLAFPTGLDLLILRAAGKAVIFHYRGSEARTASRFRRLSPFNYVSENPHRLFDRFPEDKVATFGDFVRGVANQVLVPDPELQSYVPGSRIVPRAIDLEEWRCVGPPDDPEPLIVHAPTRRVVKGTPALLAAVDALRSEGLRFRFKLVEGLSNAEARELYRQASIVVDQLRIGWYGVLSVEAMALGKPTVAYIRDDLTSHLPSELPLAIANPRTIKDVLRELIIDGSRRKELGARGRKYCERVHDADRIAVTLQSIYREALEAPSPVSLEACINYILAQDKDTTTAYQRLLKRVLAPESSLRRLAQRAWLLDVRRVPSAVSRRLTRASIQRTKDAVDQ